MLINQLNSEKIILRYVSRSGAMKKSNENVWLVLKVRPKKEKFATQHLAELGYIHYLPLVRDFKMVCNKKENMYKPLFTGYLFVANHEESIDAHLHYIRGTTGLLKLSEKEVVVTDGEIDVLKRLCDLKAAPEVVSDIVVGERITLKGGTLKGVQGVVSKIENNTYLFIESGISGIIIKVKLSENLLEVE